MNEYYYTVKEGGLWYRQYSEKTSEQITEELANSRQEVNLIDGGTTWVADFEGNLICAVWFPDGRIWDAIFGDFDESWPGFVASDDLKPMCASCGHSIEDVGNFHSTFNHTLECGYLKSSGG